MDLRRMALAMLGAVLIGGAVALAVAPAGARPVPRPPMVDDGFDRLPRAWQMRSMSSLVALGLVHPPAALVRPPVHPAMPGRGPAVPITWGPAEDMTQMGADEPGAALHPLDPLRALSGGNSSSGLVANNTTDGGLTWQAHQPDPFGQSDGAPAWLPLAVHGGHNALFAYLVPSVQDLFALTLNQSTDDGASWANVASPSLHVPGYFDDREYLWTDHDSTSPYYGRVYLTQTLFDGAGNGTYDGIAVRWTTDQGSTWTPLNALVDPTEASQGINQNEYAALAIQPGGAIVASWRRGLCCSDNPFIITENKVMWSRSTDGGATFPISGTVVTVPIAQSVSFNSHSPAGFRWQDAPNIAADPIDGTLYAVWIAYRQPNLTTTAAVYLARGTPDGSSWTAPVVVDDSNPTNYQFMPWVQVSPDHVVHVTYGAAVGDGSLVGQFYAQSVDYGQSFSPPFLVSDVTYAPASFMGDYQAASVGGVHNGSAAILATWTDARGLRDQWGRIGTFLLGPLPTATPILPTHTPGPPTATPSPTATVPSPTATSTRTPLPPTLTPCPLQFSDVDGGNPFYVYIRCLACRGILSGYSAAPPCVPGAAPCFLPAASVTRGQVAKIVVNAAGFQDAIPSTRQTFSDVPPSSPFWLYVERASLHGVISGYSTTPPCPGGVPCFLPGNSVTRGQMAKIDTQAVGYSETPPATQQTFADVPYGSPFWLYVERAAGHSVISGYSTSPPCAGVTPCFLPANNLTRGQAAKIVANTFYPNCQTPAH